MMLRVYRCPQPILDLFDNEETISLGRGTAIDWLDTLSLQTGDIVWMPDAATGQLVELKQQPLSN